MVALALSPARAARPCRYQEQDSPQTLAEGLTEYYAHIGGRVLPPESLPAESAVLFRSHDVCHVIFGLDTTLADETMADTRTMLSCDVGWTRYAKYLASNKEAKAILEVGYLTVARATVKAIPRILRAVIEARRMPKRWPWTPPTDAFDRTLAELRHEYGIRVI